LGEQFEVAAPGLCVFPGELLARRFPEEWCVLPVEVGVVGVPHIAIFIEVLLTATVIDLIPEWGVCGQPVKQALPIPVTDRVSSVGVCSLWPVAHTRKYSVY